MEFRVLGPLEVVDGDRVAPVRANREGALLAILLVNAGQLVSAARLIEELWSGAPPPGATATLQTYVRDLRRLLEPDRPAGSTSEVLVTRRPGYVLRVGPDDLDGWRFERLVEEGRRALAAGRPVLAGERLQAALGLWRGPAYGELSTEPFAMAEVARLEEARLAAVEDQVDADLALGRHAPLVGRLEALVGEHPYRERLWGQLLLALYRSGRQAEALRAFARVRGLLGEELGIEPSASLRALEEDILLQKPHLDWVAPVEERQPASTRGDGSAAGAPDVHAMDGGALAPELRSAHGAETEGGEPARAAPERGLRTFLLTDIEGSAAQWEQEPASMAAAVARHDALVAQVVRSSGGRLIKARGEGDSTFAVFELASDATVAAARLGRAFADESWPTDVPLRIRMGLMTGEAEERGGDFFGGMVNRAARLRSLALGGEIMLSGSVAALVADELPPGTAIVDRGWQSLRDLHRPEHVFQLRVHGEEEPDEDDASASDLSWVPSGDSAFVGRSEELRLLGQMWSKAAAGERSLVLVAGEPGIGKTRVAAELARQIHADGGLVLYGRWEEEALWPFQAVRAALSRYGRSCSRATLRTELGEGVRELARLLPELTERIGGGTPLRADADTERYRLFDAVDGWLTEAASRRPVLLVLDDLHWADRPSLLLLQHIMRGRPSSGLMVLATYCHTEVHPGSDLWTAMAGFRRMSGFERVPLRGLAAIEVGELVQHMAGQPPIPALGLADLLRAETGGNPFFLGEMLRHLVELGAVGPDRASRPSGAIEVPEGVREVVQARLARLSPACRKALTAAAVVGAEFDLDVAAAASGIDEDTLLEGLDEALAAGVVVEGSGGSDHYSFAHSVVRKTLHDELSQSRRARLHHRIALALEASRGDGGSRLAELAYHFAQGVAAGGADKAVEYARRAGDQAMSEVAYEAAARQYRHAIELLGRLDPAATAPRAELLLALGDAHNRAGEVAAGAAEFLEAAEAARALDNPELLAAAALGLGGVLPASVGPDPRAQALLEEALTRLGTGDSRLRALALGRLAHWMHHAGPRKERAALCGEAVPMARRLSDRATLAAVLTSSYWALDGPDDLDGRLRTAAEIVGLGEDLGDQEVVLHGLKASLHARFEAGELADADRVAARMGALGEELRQPEYLRLTLMWKAMRAGLEGRFVEADRLAADARAFLEERGHSQAGPIYFALTLPWRWLRGSMADARPELDRALASDPRRAAPRALSAWVFAETGELDRARSELEAISPAGLEEVDRNFDWWTVLVAVTTTVSLTGLTEWAESIQGLMLPYEARNATVGEAAFLGSASHHLGVLSAVLGHWDEAATYFAAALERHRAMNAAPFVALSEQAYADVLLARASPGDVARARELTEGATRAGRELDLRAAQLRGARDGRRYPDRRPAPPLAR